MKRAFKRSPFEVIARFVVEKRILFYLIFAVGVVAAIFTMGSVKVNNDLVAYLPPDSATKVGSDIMDREFDEYGSMKIMLSNVSYEEAFKVKSQIEGMQGIQLVTFDNTDAHYKAATALIEVTFEDDGTSEISDRTFQEINRLVDGYDATVTNSFGGYSDYMQKEMTVILLIAAAVIVVVLLFTSKSFMEIPIFIVVFAVAAILNMGSNALLGEISFISNSIAIVMQLALAIDYAIIFCHRYIEESKFRQPKEAVISALSKAMPEILSSGLTTVSGLVALMLMQLRIGMDMGLVLAKGVILSAITVFFLMPGLMLMFSKLMNKTRHRSFVPNITVVGKAVVKARFVLPAVFLVVIVASAVLQSFNHYVFSYEGAGKDKKTASMIAAEKIETKFGKSNSLAVIVPKGDYEKEKQILKIVGEKELIDSATGMANITLNGDIGLTDGITPEEFADFAGVEYDTVKLLYVAYGLENGDYFVINGVDHYRVALVNIVNYLYKIQQEGVIRLDEATAKEIEAQYETLNKVQSLLEGETYSRMIFNINGPVESEEVFSLIEQLRTEVGAIYPNGYLIGESVSSYDLKLSFSDDLMKINLLTVAFILIILLFTFKSIGIPIILILTIQGSIWINFALPVLTSTPLFFLSYLIISAIQMGATIDYAIVITNRYLMEKQTKDNKTAIVDTLNACFPTIFTSGSIMTVAGFLVGGISSDPIISSIGSYLGKGTLISLLAVLLVLPQLLLLGEKIIQKTSLKSLKGDRPKLTSRDFSGNVDGRVCGMVNGYVDAEVNGKIRGSVDAVFTQQCDRNDCTEGGEDASHSEKAYSASKEAREMKSEKASAERGEDAAKENDNEKNI